MEFLLEVAALIEGCRFEAKSVADNAMTCSEWVRHLKVESSNQEWPKSLPRDKNASSSLLKRDGSMVLFDSFHIFGQDRALQRVISILKLL